VNVVPFSFDLSTLVQRSVASLYSNLVTRPTGRALRMGIETQIGELGSACISVLDFTDVVVLDYSCADEAVAKLILRFLGSDRPADAYFVAKGLCEQHRQPLEAVLARHRLVMVAHLEGVGYDLLGDADETARAAWHVVEEGNCADEVTIATRIAQSETSTRTLLDGLAERRVLLRGESAGMYYALSSLLSAV
jgi:hypothetical protein